MFPNWKREISKCFFPFSSKFLPSNPFNSREKSFRMRNEVNKWNKGTGSYRGCLLKRMALEFTCHLPRNMKQRVAGTRWKWDEAGVVERGWRRGRIKREREREHVVIHLRTYACPKWYYVTIYAPPPSPPAHASVMFGLTFMVHHSVFEIGAIKLRKRREKKRRKELWNFFSPSFSYCNKYKDRGISVLLKISRGTSA